MILRWMLIGLGVVSAAIAGVVEVGALASAQVAQPPVIVVATVPPQPTPLPPLRLPREEFAEEALVAPSPSPDAQSLAGAVSQTAILASYGVVTVSYDEQQPNNSAALVATPHGVVLAHVGQVLDGFRIRAIDERGVTFDGGVFIPVGYSQSNNPAVPAISSSLPAKQVPVNVNTLATPTPAPVAPQPARTFVPRIFHSPGPTGIPQVDGTQALPTPGIVDPLVTPTPSA